MIHYKKNMLPNNTSLHKVEITLERSQAGATLSFTRLMRVFPTRGGVIAGGRERIPSPRPSLFFSLSSSL